MKLIFYTRRRTTHIFFLYNVVQPVFLKKKTQVFLLFWIKVQCSWIRHLIPDGFVFKEKKKKWNTSGFFYFDVPILQMTNLYSTFNATKGGVSEAGTVLTWDGEWQRVKIIWSLDTTYIPNISIHTATFIFYFIQNSSRKSKSNVKTIFFYFMDSGRKSYISTIIFI